MAWNRTLIIGLTTALAWTSAQLWVLRSEPRSAAPPKHLAYAAERVEAERATALLLATAAERARPSFPEVVQSLRPSVVSITVTFEEPAEMERRGHGSAANSSSGTGIVLDRQGHILTNLHVVRGAAEIEVELSSGDRSLARLLGADPETDLAVLSLTTDEELHPIRWLQDGLEPRVAEPIVVVGNAYGLGWTVSQGIVSSLHRDPLEGLPGYSNYIQTDASIHPGNSGGPLVNQKGEVIGIASRIGSERGERKGIGFALPAADARFVAHELIQRQRVERGFLGLFGQSLADTSRHDREALRVTTTRGLLLTAIAQDSPADEAGLRAGDVLLELDGEPILSYASFRARIARTPIGQMVALTVQRHGLREVIPLPVAPANGRDQAAT